jgi:hypothetical protein
MTTEQTPCTTCNGAGWYKYDHNHSKPCEDCCPHDNGWWDLSEKYHGSKFIKGGDNGCCLAGCGTMRRDLKVEMK